MCKRVGDTFSKADQEHLLWPTLLTHPLKTDQRNVSSRFLLIPPEEQDVCPSPVVEIQPQINAFPTNYLSRLPKMKMRER